MTDKADKAFKVSLAELTAEVTKNAKIASDIQSDNKIILELVNIIHQKVEDMSRKFDEVLNGGIKQPKGCKIVEGVKECKSDEKSEEKVSTKKAAVKKSDPKDASKVIKNIMTYFKVKYTENQKYFDDIFEENQVSALLEEHASELTDKKGANKIKTEASILYKNLNKNQKNKVRERMMEENEATSVNNDDDIEGDESE